MATSLVKNIMKKPATLAAIIAVLVIAFVLFSVPISGQTAKFYATPKQQPGAGAGMGTCFSNTDCQPGFYCEYTKGSRGTCMQNPQCSDGKDNDGDGQMDLLDLGCSNYSDNNELLIRVNLKAGESVNNFGGHKITLKNVGSATTNTPVIVDVDGAVETITGTETVSNVVITVLATSYDPALDKRSAILELS